MVICAGREEGSGVHGTFVSVEQKSEWDGVRCWDSGVMV